jgi:hypothetical protein
MGLTWAAGWALGGVLIGVASILLPFLPWDAFFKVFDAPLPALAVPGFFAGMFFSTVLGIAGRRRRFNELSLSRFAIWGAVGGLMLIAFPFVLVGVGLADTEGSSVRPLQALAVIAGPFILLSVISASATLWLARRAEGRAVIDSDEGERLIDSDIRELPAGDVRSATWAASEKAPARPMRQGGPRDA